MELATWLFIAYLVSAMFFHIGLMYLNGILTTKRMWKWFNSEKFDPFWHRFMDKFGYPLMAQAGGLLINKMVNNLKMSLLGNIGQRTKQMKKSQKKLSKAILTELSPNLGDAVADMDLPFIDNPEVAAAIGGYLNGIESKGMQIAKNFIAGQQQIAHPDNGGERGTITMENLIGYAKSQGLSIVDENIPLDGETEKVPKVQQEVSFEKTV